MTRLKTKEEHSRSHQSFCDVCDDHWLLWQSPKSGMPTLEAAHQIVSWNPWLQTPRDQPVRSNIRQSLGQPWFSNQSTKMMIQSTETITWTKQQTDPEGWKTRHEGKVWETLMHEVQQYKKIKQWTRNRRTTHLCSMICFEPKRRVACKCYFVWYQHFLLWQDCMSCSTSFERGVQK